MTKINNKTDLIALVSGSLIAKMPPWPPLKLPFLIVLPLQYNPMHSIMSALHFEEN